MAELPREYLETPYRAATGKSIRVGAGGNLQGALDQAQRGDEVVLAAGATFTGTFVLRAKPGTAADGWIVVRTEQLGQLPPEGTRVTAAQAGLMPKLVTPNTAPALKTEPGASGWRLVGLEITAAPAVTAQNYGLVFLGDAGQTALSQVPSDLVLDRVYVHGQATTNLSRCIALNSARTVITDSYIVECHGKGFDSQAIAGWNGPGPYKIVNNTLQGAGENLMFGGADPQVAGLVPSDIEIRRNYLYTPLSWKGVWTKKNLFELKNAVRVLFEENVLDGSWLDAQDGFAILVRSTNQAGGCRWCRSADVTIRRNYITHAGAGINVIPDGNYPQDSVTRRVVITENVFDAIGIGGYTGKTTGFQLLPGVEDVQITRNVVTGNLRAFMLLESTTKPSVRTRFTDNIVTRGQYGMACSGVGPGLPSWSSCVLNGTWSGNTIVGTPSGTYPVGTSWSRQEPASTQALRRLVLRATTGVVVP